MEPKNDDVIKELTEKLSNLTKEIESIKAKPVDPTPKPADPPKPKDEDEDDLSKKLEREALDKQKKMSEVKEIESSVKFNATLNDWVKTNKSLLPDSINDLIVQADKENFNSEIEKSKALKVGIINQFYALQSNLDLLTDTQKKVLDEFKALTKAERELRVQSIYENIFEPSFHALRNAKRAEKISKGLGDSDEKHSAYVQKMIQLSKKKYIGEK